MCSPSATITPTLPTIWNGPICPTCGRGYIQPSTTWTFTTYPTYQPRHRKPGPAQ